MKLLSLNTWGGSCGEILLDFVKAHADSVDIFCFQEVYQSSETQILYDKTHIHLYDELCGLLPGYSGFFSQISNLHMGDPTGLRISHGLAAYVKANLKPQLVGSVPILPHDVTPDDGRVLQHLSLKINGQTLHVFNFHGYCMPGDKLDTRERLLQSQKILDELQKWQTLKILCGDFNLELNTQSVSMLEKDMRNLIKDFKIENTRNEVSWNKFPPPRQHFADYTFVSPEIKVKGFEVPYNLVSDHLPMILEFEI